MAIESFDFNKVLISTANKLSFNQPIEDFADSLVAETGSNYNAWLMVKAAEVYLELKIRDESDDGMPETLRASVIAEVIPSATLQSRIDAERKALEAAKG